MTNARLRLFAENVHFQHTAKFINYLINQKGNYTLQVRARARVSFLNANEMIFVGRIFNR